MQEEKKKKHQQRLLPECNVIEENIAGWKQPVKHLPLESFSPEKLMLNFVF